MSESSFRSGPGPISVFEAESYARSLECLPLEQVGTERWLQQHDHLEKLNLQAHYSALSAHDEYVVDALITHDKVATLIHELLVSEVWREKVFPLMVDDMSHLTAVKTYMVLYHEATLCNLLEVLLYHQHVAIHLDTHHDAMMELMDYCVRRAQSLQLKKGYKTIWEPVEENAKNIESASSVADSLRRQCTDISFSTAACAISILRFLTDHLPHLSASLMLRLLHTHDVVLILVPLIEDSPFTRQRGNQMEKFIDQKWVVVPPADRLKLTKLEGQLWLTCYNLMMETKCRQAYNINTHRKEIIIRLRRFFTDILCDQLPPLRDLKRAIDELSIMQPPPPTASSLAIIEQIPEMREEIVKQQDWKAIAKKQMATVFSSDASARQSDIARLAATYDLDAYDEVLDDPKCAICGDIAMKRCSRCHLEWYCSRPCQVKAWNQHKSICQVICNKQKQKSTSAATCANPTLITSLSSTPSTSTSTTPSASQLASMDASTLIRQLHINEDKENTQKSSNTTAPTAAPPTTTKRPMIQVLDD